MPRFEREHTIRCLDANKHNHHTTCYYLMLAKMQRKGIIEPMSQYQNVVHLQSPNWVSPRSNSNPRRSVPPQVKKEKPKTSERRAVSNKRGHNLNNVRQLLREDPPRDQ